MLKILSFIIIINSYFLLPKQVHPPFLKESTTLRDALKKRSQEPTPWNALDSSHKHFAEQAEAVLAECKYKEMAQKVIAVSKLVWPMSIYPHHSNNIELITSNYYILHIYTTLYKECLNFCGRWLPIVLFFMVSSGETSSSACSAIQSFKLQT